MENKLKLVRLPRIKGNPKYFYAIGYYTEDGSFVFALLNREIIRNSPLRSISADKWDGSKKENEIVIIDDISELN